MKSSLNRMRTRWLAVAGSVLLLGLAGCHLLPDPVSDPTRYYLLSGAASSSNATTGVPKGTLHVGVRAVELPLYLRNNRTMVVRSGKNEVHYQDYARWAEPLEQAVQRTVRDRLTASDRVASADASPFSPEVKRDYDVIIRVLQCEGDQGSGGRGTAQFSATYEIVDEHNAGNVVVRRTFVSQPVSWDGNDYGTLAAHLGDAVAALGDDVAANLPK